MTVLCSLCSGVTDGKVDDHLRIAHPDQMLSITVDPRTDEATVDPIG